MSEAMGVEYWIMEREGRLPATGGGGWIACKDRMPENDDDVEVITRGHLGGNHWTAYNGRVTHWRPLPIPVDPHADAACLFDDRYRPTVEQARAAARHVAGCAECRAKLEAKGGA